METKRTKVPVFRQIAEDLRARIESGVVGPDDRLPTEADLSQEYSTTRTTIRAAYDVLIRDGVVEKRGLSGYFVREIKPRTWLLADADGFVDPWREMIRAEGGARTREMVAVRIDHGHAPMRATILADLLNLDDTDALVACRATVRILDGDPVDLTDTYVPYERVKDGPFMAGGDIDVYALMSQAAKPTAFLDTLVFRNPLPSESARLELPDATGVVEVVRLLTFDDDDDPAMLVHSIYGAAGAEFACARA